MGLRRRTWAAIVAVVALVSGGSTALANHVFPDVTTNSAFHTEVSNVVGAGCATGFNDDTFRPLDAPTRQQFAAWTNRCGGRVGATGAGSDNVAAGSVFTAVGTDITIEAGAAPADTSVGGFVFLTATVQVRVNSPEDASCPCFVQARLVDRTDNQPGPAFADVVATAGNDVGDAVTNIALNGVFPIDPGETKSFGVDGLFIDADVAGVDFAPMITALYVPFGPDGDNTLPFGP